MMKILDTNKQKQIKIVYAETIPGFLLFRLLKDEDMTSNSRGSYAFFNTQRRMSR